MRTKWEIMQHAWPQILMRRGYAKKKNLCVYGWKTLNATPEKSGLRTETGLDWTNSGQGTVADIYKHNNEILSSPNAEKVLQYVRLRMYIRVCVYTILSSGTKIETNTSEWKERVLNPLCLTFGNVSAAGAIAINAHAGPNNMLFTLLGRYLNKESV